MIGSPDITLMGESARHLREAFGEVGDIWRHEGLKKGVEAALGTASHSELSRWILQQACGGEFYDRRLATNVGGIALDGPVGIAPGWDKTGKTVMGWQELGAHHITPGGIPKFPQPGNHMTRLVTFDEWLGDHGKTKSLNAYGFPSKGAGPVVRMVDQQKETGKVRIPVVMQATLNKEMYEEANRDGIPARLADTVRQILPVADGINLGLSSLNTKGMRDAQAYDSLYEIIMRVKDVTGDDTPLGFKGDGDGGEERLDMYCRLAQATELNYLELINTTALPHIKGKYVSLERPGGLGGSDPDYQDLALWAVRYVYESVGDKTDIMGMGGVNSPERAMKMVRAGASGIGINTGVRELGAQAVISIERGMSREMDGFPLGTTLENVIGIDTARGPKKAAA